VKELAYIWKAWYMGSVAEATPQIGYVVGNTPRYLGNKYWDNPVLRLGPAGAWDDGEVREPAILYEDGVYNLLYAGGRDVPYPKPLYIGLATSNDGITFTKYVGNPILSPGPAGEWDDGFVVDPYVVKVGATYFVYYGGFGTGPQGLGLATGSKLTELTKYGRILDLGSPGAWDDYEISCGAVLYLNGLWRLYYYGSPDGTKYEVGLALSTDGYHWSKYKNNPILEVGESGQWDDTEVAHPEIVYLNGVFYLFYHGYGGAGTPHRTGLAISRDGVNFRKIPENPIIDVGTTWDTHIEDIAVLPFATYKAITMTPR